MESVLLAALLAAAPHSATSAAPAPLDVGCFRLMADLAGDADPRIQSLGQMGAQYFLGRIDAAAPDFDVDSVGAAPRGSARDDLLRRCGAAMQAGGHDFRTIGRALAPPRPTA